MARASGSIEAVLGGFLRDQGLGEPSTAALSATLLRDYPLVRRVGPTRAASLLCAQGMDPAVAREAALTLLAFEWLGRVPYERALELLTSEASTSEALGAGLAGARLRRESRGSRRLSAPGALCAPVVGKPLAPSRERTARRLGLRVR